MQQCSSLLTECGIEQFSHKMAIYVHLITDHQNCSRLLPSFKKIIWELYQLIWCSECALESDDDLYHSFPYEKLSFVSINILINIFVENEKYLKIIISLCDDDEEFPSKAPLSTAHRVVMQEKNFQ